MTTNKQKREEEAEVKIHFIYKHPADDRFDRGICRI